MKPPDKIGRYKIEGQIGRGGMAVIYLANDPLMQRNVAIKVLSAQLNADPDFAFRFQREMQVIASLDHPAIVPIYDSGEEDDQPYYVMRYMPGGSLMQRLRISIISLSDCIRIIGRIAPALDEANRQGIIHRDIKPGNILFDQRNDAYLSDFGIVKISETPSSITGNNILGTPGYMSPEIARGDAEIDGRSDVYSLGVLLFRMLTGILPFIGDNPMAIAMKHITDPVPNILEYNPELPANCALIISKSMAKDKESRFSNATEMVEALNNLGTLPEAIQGQPPYSGSTEVTLSTFDLKQATIKTSSFTPTEASPVFTHNLPPQASKFVGREREIENIISHLNNPDCRLLTLLGPGGIGKTRSALHAGMKLLGHFQHGIYFIGLASINSLEFMVSTIAETVKFSFYSQEEPKTQLINYLRGKNMLLILDNFEHLIEGVDLVADILNTAPYMKLLATSRERLNLEEEWIYQLDGMDYPTGKKIENFENFTAVELFIDRAMKVSPNLALENSDKWHIARICQLVDGIPLGIELAAVWVRMLSFEEISLEIEKNLDFLTSSLRNVSQRHRSLRAVFDYSWNLLSDTEKNIFQSLSVFRGTFSRKAAEEVANASLYNLSALVDKSLVRKTESGHYELLEILRQYCYEKLSRSTEVLHELEEAHSRYYSIFLAARELSLKGGKQKEAIEEIRENIENIRSSWQWSIQHNHFDIIHNSIESLYRYYEIIGWLQEGAESFEFLLSSLRSFDDPQSLEFTQLLGKTQSHLGAFYYRIGAHNKAQDLLIESVDLLRGDDNKEELAFSLNYLGAVAYLNKEYEEANKLLSESLSVYKEFQNKLGIAISLHHLGLVARDIKDYQTAKNRFTESLKVNTEIGDKFGIAISLNNLGIVARDLGEYEEAKELHKESLIIRQSIRDRWGIANSLDGLGLVEFHLKNYEESLQLLQESQIIYEEIGDQRRLVNLQTIIDKVTASIV